MGQGGWPTLLGWAMAASLMTAVLTLLTIGYARRHQMIDAPGRRRSHSVPTPRGGGIAIVIAMLLCVAAPTAWRLQADVDPTGVGISPLSWLVASTLAVLIVAWVGWIDDHGGLSARLRFAVHCVAAGVLLSPLLPIAAGWLQPAVSPPPLAWLLIGFGVLTVIVLAIVWSINLHNFMDGINGLLASQAIFVLVVAAVAGLYWSANDGWELLLIAAATVAGFLPFNFPRARIFLGDVGSGALGLLVAITVLAMLIEPALDPAVGLIACSAFVIDATATLLSRMLRGRRWYSAHHEHLYHWLVRSGFGHAHVVGFYMGWNLIVVIPAILLIQSGRSPMSPSSMIFTVSPLGIAALLMVYALGLAVWVFGRRYSVARVKAGSSHGLA